MARNLADAGHGLARGIAAHAARQRRRPLAIDPFRQTGHVMQRPAKNPAVDLAVRCRLPASLDIGNMKPRAFGHLRQLVGQRPRQPEQLIGIRVKQPVQIALRHDPVRIHRLSFGLKRGWLCEPGLSPVVGVA